MVYKATVVVCSEIRIRHSTQSEHHVDFWMLNLVVRRETASIKGLNSFWWCQTNMDLNSVINYHTALLFCGLFNDSCYTSDFIQKNVGIITAYLTG
jgi:hypothetical protein